MAKADTKSRSTWWQYQVYQEHFPTMADVAAKLLEYDKELIFVVALHDKDVFPDDHERAGEPKKPHYHILVKHHQQCRLSYAKQLSVILGSKGEPETAHPSHTLPYFTHQNFGDRPDKRLYDYRDFFSQGVDLHKFLDMGDSAALGSLSDLFSYCSIRGIRSYHMLVRDIFAEKTMEERFGHLLLDPRTHSVITNYFRSIGYTRAKDVEIIEAPDYISMDGDVCNVNADTGEVEER